MYIKELLVTNHLPLEPIVFGPVVIVVYEILEEIK